MGNQSEAELETLVRDIDRDPDRLHADVTPSVLKLGELGLPAARAVLQLLDAPEFLTRKRAQRVLEEVVKRRYGWRPGVGQMDHQAQANFQALLKANGDYQADIEPEARRRSIEQWRRWLEAQDQ